MGSLPLYLHKRKHRQPFCQFKTFGILKMLFSRFGRTSARRISQYSGISQRELLKTRNYGQAFNENCYLYHALNGSYNANTPLKWFAPVKFAGLGGFWPSACTPLVAFFVGMNLNFWYQFNFGNAEYERRMEEPMRLAKR